MSNPAVAKHKNGPYGTTLSRFKVHCSRPTTSPAKGARKNTMRVACQPMKLPIIAINVTSPKPMASFLNVAPPIKRTLQMIPVPNATPNRELSNPAQWKPP